MKKLTSFLAIVAVFGCGSGGSKFGDDDAGGDGSEGDDGGEWVIPGSDAEAGPTCVGLECQVVTCGGGATTTISGSVYDPAGRNPLFNVYVYIPNAPLDAIKDGAVCTQCQAPASGAPMPGASLSNSKGQFILSSVPSGMNIPIVFQAGKFRRKYLIPEVKQCMDNKIGKKDSKGFETITRLPKKDAETNIDDNMPTIALATGGCDSLQCLLWKIGIDESEWTSGTGKGHMQVYSGSGGAVINGSTNAQTTLWEQVNTPKTLPDGGKGKYDIVVNSCECSPINRGTAYTPMLNYVNTGGRMFGTHYHYNWFDNSSTITEWQPTATWHPGTYFSAPYYIDTTFPKGKALDEWIQFVFGSLAPPKGEIVTSGAGDVGVVAKTTTRWIYNGAKAPATTGYNTSYLSFNAPVKAAKVEDQCGRAVFSDLHVSSGGGGTFPTGCGAFETQLSQQEAALEFLFFDLSSCVQDESKPIVIPPPN